MDRRGFIGRLVAGGFGLVAGKAIEVVEAKHADLQAVDQWVFPPLNSSALWIDSIEPRIERAAIDVTAPHDAWKRYVPGDLDCSLDVRFRGPGCMELAKMLLEKMYAQDGPFRKV